MPWDLVSEYWVTYKTTIIRPLTKKMYIYIYI